jgi:DNA-binding MarR family transcriptional regulator
MPQLALAMRRTRGDVPEALRSAGQHGERHIATLVSLAVAGPATVSEVAERLHISRAHASLVVGELARAGLVEREHDPADRRRIVVSLSDRARPAMAEMGRRNARPLIRFLEEDLSEMEAERFIDNLERLIARLREQADARA